jgi:streptogramin lyase
MPGKPRRLSVPLLASAVALALALPTFAAASPLGEVTFYHEGLRSAAKIEYTTAGPDGNVWFVDGRSSGAVGLGKITPAGAITEYICGETLSGCDPETLLTGITAGPEGDTHLWFTDRGGPNSPPSIGRIDSASPGTVEEFSIEAEGGNAESAPQGIVAGAEGKLWFTDNGATRGIGVFDPSAPEGERVEEFTGLSKTSNRPRGIAFGSDGHAWFTEVPAWPPEIGRIDPSTHLIEEFELNYGTIPGGTTSASEKSSIVAGPDGDVWFTDAKEKASGICKIEVAEPHEIECLSEGLVEPSGSKPHGLTVADGELWFTDRSHYNESQWIHFQSIESGGWEDGDEFELCSEDGSNCATGIYKTEATERSGQVLGALESIYGTGNVGTYAETYRVHVGFKGELAATDVGQTSCKRASGTGAGCYGETAADGRPDAIGRVNLDGEIRRYPIEGVTGVSSITYVSGGDVWFPASSEGVKSIGKFGIEVGKAPLTLSINQGEGTVVSSPAGLECTGRSGDECDAEFEQGSKITLTASPAAGYRFYSWQNCPAEGYDDRQCTVTMSEAKEVGVKFRKTWSLTVSKVEGSEPAIVKSDPGGKICYFSCSTVSLSYDEGTEVTVFYRAPEHRRFVEFTGGVGQAEVEACNGQTTCTYTADESDSSIEVLFEEDEKTTLSLQKEGGGQARIKIQPAHVLCIYTCLSTTADFYTEPEAEEATVEWTLKRGTGSIEWSSGAGGCTGSSSSFEGSCKVTMSEAHELVAKLE